MNIPAFSEKAPNLPDNGLRNTVFKRLAKRVGCTTAEYTAHRDKGERFCFGCHQWQRESAFDASRHRCGDCRRK